MSAFWDHALYEFHEYKFNLDDEEQVFKRLFGHQLYGRTDVAIRELLQNAIDATRVRVALEVSKCPGWNDLTSREQWKLFQRTYSTRKNDLHLTVKLYTEEDPLTGKKETWLHICDQGVGMARYVIEKYLLKVGRSRWREDPRVNRLPIGTVGEFGVGFLSTFMVSDRTIIDTQSCLPNEEGIRVTIYNWRGYLATQPIDLPCPGTSVRLLLKEDARDSLEDICSAVKYWCPFLELPVQVTGLLGDTSRIEPRHLGRMPQQDKALCIRFHGSESIALIEPLTRIRTEEVPPSVCQDGLVIPEIPPPILEEPAQQILRWRGIRIDLRGADRVPLDLSRNLTEERADALWRRITKLVWAGIATNGLFFQEGRTAFFEFLNSEFVVSSGRRLTTIGPRKRFSLSDVNEILKRERLQFAELRSMNVKQIPMDKVRAIVDCEQFSTLIYPDPEFVNDQNALWLSETHRSSAESFFGEEWLLEEEDDLHDQRTQEPKYLKINKRPIPSEFDKVMTQYEERMRNEAIPETSPYRNADVLDYWADELSGELYPSVRMSRHIATILEHYCFACRAENGFSGLSHRDGLGIDSLRIENLAALWLSDRWIAVRHPSKGMWCMLCTDDLEVVRPKNIRKQLDFYEYILLILYSMQHPSYSLKWGFGWPNSKALGELGERIEDLIDRRQEREEEDQTSWPYAGTYKENENGIVYFDEDESSESESESGGDDNGEDGDQSDEDEANSSEDELPLEPRKREFEVESEYRTFARYILPNVDAKALKAVLTPWDVEHWERVYQLGRK